MRIKNTQLTSVFRGVLLIGYLLFVFTLGFTLCLIWVHSSKHVVNPESNSTTRSLIEKKNYINFVKFQDSSYVSIDKLKMTSKKNNDNLKQGHPFPYREPRDSLPLRTCIQKQKPLISYFF